MVFKPALDVFRHTGRLVKFYRFEPRICRELHSSSTRNVQIKNIDYEFNLRERKETEESDEFSVLRTPLRALSGHSGVVIAADWLPGGEQVSVL